MSGKYYDELEVGMKFKHAGRTVTEMDNVASERSLYIRTRRWLDCP